MQQWHRYNKVNERGGKFSSTRQAELSLQYFCTATDTIEFDLYIITQLYLQSTKLSEFLEANDISSFNIKVPWFFEFCSSER